MADARISFPGPGCIVEAMQDNKPVQYMVLESQADSVRLLNTSRREGKMPISRLLPWMGPAYPGERSRQEMVDILEQHKALRETLAASINIQEIWELAQGEVARAPAFWLAELLWAAPGYDQVAAMGHAALACKSHFKFSPPDFEIYDAQRVALKLEELEAARKREEITSIGAAFFRTLWDIHCRRRSGLLEKEIPEAALAARLKEILFQRLADPELHDADGTWKLLTKALPEDPHLALHLAVVWGLLPEHHNFWLDRVGYDPAPDWAAPFAEDMAGIHRCFTEKAKAEVPVEPESPLVSIDAATTKDVDDAVSVKRNADGGFSVALAFSCPALCWPFGSALDKAVLRRATSLYLPEGDLHMLPEEVGIRFFSLSAGETRPVLLLEMFLDTRGDVVRAAPRLTWTRVAANLTFDACQSLLEPLPNINPPPEALEAARPYADMLDDAYALAKLLQEKRLASGAVVTDRPDPRLELAKDDAGRLRVTLECPPPCSASHLVVSELMILANSALASWARERGVPLWFRTQDVALPKEFSGVWTKPEEIARVLKHLPAAGLEVEPRPHAGLGVPVYASLTSPLRRYADLVNEAQIVHYLTQGRARLNQSEMAALLPFVSARLDQVGQVQRFRPRYWKLVFFRQQGDEVWWDGVVTEENDLFATVSLPFAQMLIRVKRRFLEEKIYTGQPVKVRVGKVHPLTNEIQVTAVMER